MPLSWNEIKSRAVEFSKEWEHETREHAEAKTFWDQFLNVFGISRRRVGIFEKHVKKLGNKDGFIDLFWPGTLLVEHKSRGKSLDAAFEQSIDYFNSLKDYELPKYVIVSDFHKMRLYNLDNDTKKEFKVKNLVDNVQLFSFIAGYQKRTYKESDPVNIEAAELMGKLHDKLKENGYEGHQLEIYLVRLLFCLFADDTGIFEKDIFLDFIQNRTASDGSDLGSKLTELFQYLNTPENKRPNTLDEAIKIFPYINGKLFEEILPVASFDKKMRRILFESCYLDWGKVSPAIFGSLFQSVMDAELRRNLGAHYTSEKNILKLINALFMDELWEKFYKIKNNINRLRQFYDEIAELKFFDPACGCGNFLIIAYRELRLLEIEIIKILYSRSGGELQQMFNIQDYSKIDVDSFYGIEIEEFPARIAEVAMWLIDHQMNMKLSKALGQYYVRLPLKNAANIINDNALNIDWNTVLPPSNNVYLLGNPPFSGSRHQTKEQKSEMKIIFKGIKNAGKLDYVAAWYLKASQYIQGTTIQVGFVSTNSICQGEQVGVLWDVLINKYDIKINFAHTTFKWSNDAKGKAAVYVVIIGFSTIKKSKKYIYEYDTPTSDPYKRLVKNINPYLVEGNDILIKSLLKPICNVSEVMKKGSKAYDYGFLTLNEKEKNELIKKEPLAEKFIKKLMSADNFLNNKYRYCLWLVDATPNELNNMKSVKERIKNVQIKRSKSSDKGIRQLAEKPALFENNQPENDYLAIPVVSSENREYVPMDYLSKDIIVTNACFTFENATLYDFGILTSKMHMTWMRYTCGRLESRYRYSKTLVYNTFPFPENVSDKMIQKIEKKAQAILDARKLYPDSTLVNLYDPLTMPPELRKAHKELDKEVDNAYGKTFDTDLKRMKLLFELYNKYTDNS